MREVIVTVVVGFLKAYLWLILIPLGVIGFFIED